jgi:hypothetical protein
VTGGSRTTGPRRRGAARGDAAARRRSDSLRERRRDALRPRTSGHRQLLVKTKLPKAEFLTVGITVHLRACPPVLAAHVTAAAAQSDLLLYASIPRPVSRAPGGSNS